MMTPSKKKASPKNFSPDKPAPIRPYSTEVSNNKLWNRICQYQINDPGAKFTFIKKLTYENNWSTEFAIKAILEYKKFIYLICISSEPLAPSKVVDKVWHLHLLFTFSYWNIFCQTVLHKEVHHTPEIGGKTNKNEVIRKYNQTKLLYQREFKTKPPKKIWPPAELVFGDKTLPFFTP